MAKRWSVTVVRARKKGDTFALRARGPRGEDLRERVTGDNLAKADLLRQQLERDLNDQEAPGELTVIALMDRRIAELVREAERGEKSQESVLGLKVSRRRLAPLLGGMPVADVDRAALLRVRDALSAELGPVTVNTHFRRAAYSWRWCEARGLIDRPWPKIQPLKRPPARKRPFTPAEVEGVLAWAKGWEGGVWYPILALIADTGRRVSEVCQLKGRDLDRAERTVRVRQKGNRVLVLPISEEVLSLVPERGPDEWLFPRKRRARNGGGLGPARRDCVLGVVKRATEALGIADRERLDTHSFRRAFVSHGTRAGVPNDVIRRLTGHESAAMLLHYQRETVGDDLRAAQDQVKAWRAASAAAATAQRSGSP